MRTSQPRKAGTVKTHQLESVQEVATAMLESEIDKEGKREVGFQIFEVV